MWASITVVVRKYLGRALALVGPDWQYAKHGHLIEYGHEIVRERRRQGRLYQRTKEGRLRIGSEVVRQGQTECVHAAVD